jgi:hypothetical protein
MLNRPLRIGIIGLAILVVGGCAKPLEVGSITEIRPSNGARGTDLYADQRAKGQQVPEFSGDQLFEVRTFAPKEGSGSVEFAGAACSVTGRDFAATATSPARIRVPLYRTQSSALSVTCTHPGLQQRMVVVEAVDVTRQQRYSTGAGAGVIGLVASVAVDGMSDNTKNDWKYPLAKLEMVPAEGKKP